jgi:hypothetical protein
MDYKSWYQWWGTGKPAFANEANAAKIWLEAECGTVGSNWQTMTDPTASKGSYLMVKSGISSTQKAPGDSAVNMVVIPFTIDKPGTYNVLAKVNSAEGIRNSYWLKLDNGSFERISNGFNGTGWNWGRVKNFNLGTGSHTLTIAFREAGAKLDNLIQIAHNVEVGNNTVIAAQAGISGSTKLGNNVQIGGQAGLAGHLQLADGSKVNAQAGLGKSLKEPNTAVTGSPAYDYSQAIRAQATARTLPELEKRIRELEAMVKKLGSERIS